ncbi:MAG: TIGR02391 family protein [Synergistales bacterium]|nr:TIGR02391 family protein [Synergistales bacterium]
MNYRLIAVQIGDLLKDSTSVNEINRLAGAIFRFRRESFPNEAITSQRAQLIHDWILSLARQEMDPEERNQLLIQFCHSLANDQNRKEVDKVLISAGISQGVVNREDHALFLARDFHPEIIRHCRELFLQGNYFHAVFEACKAYNLCVKQKAQSTKDGASLMLDVWGCDKGVLKITTCATQTDKDVQEGIKFLSAGLMQAIRNPTAHEPAILWPISRQDCLDILGLISFLFRQLDKAVYFKAE